MALTCAAQLIRHKLPGSTWPPLREAGLVYIIVGYQLGQCVLFMSSLFILNYLFIWWPVVLFIAIYNKLFLVSTATAEVVCVFLYFFYIKGNNPVPVQGFLILFLVEGRFYL